MNFIDEDEDTYYLKEQLDKANENYISLNNITCPRCELEYPPNASHICPGYVVQCSDCGYRGSPAMHYQNPVEKKLDTIIELLNTIIESLETY